VAGDLNAENAFWNSAVSNPSGEKLLRLFDVNQFEISALQCPTHSPVGIGHMLDIVVPPKCQSDVVFDILDSDDLPIWYSTYWIMSKLGISLNLLKNSQIGINFKTSLHLKLKVTWG
jgi:hypothetical protein